MTTLTPELTALQQAWAKAACFVILDLASSDHTQNFFSTWAAWRADPHRCEQLIFITRPQDPATFAQSFKEHPLGPWPPTTPDSHRVSLDEGHVHVLLLLWGQDLRQALRQLHAKVDAFYLSPEMTQTHPEHRDLFKSIAKLAVPNALLLTPNHHEHPTRQLTQRFLPPSPAAFRPSHRGHRHALIIGAGLAGCAAAWALSEQGWTSTVLDREAEPAQATSGNLGGLMHGTFNAPDSLHARWFRAAAILTHRLAAPALAAGDIQGQLDGLLRLEPRLNAAQAQAQLDHVGLPTDYIRWLDRDQACTRTGLNLASGGWWYTQAGWLAPQSWARWLLAQAKRRSQAQFIGQTHVARLERADLSPNAPWQAFDAEDRLLAEAPVVVVANAWDVHRLLPSHARIPRLMRVRGQTSVLGGATPGLHPPKVPLSGQGYALHLPDGRVLAGATSQENDLDPKLRLLDHQLNLERAMGLGVIDDAHTALTHPALNLSGRVGWRAMSTQRLPLIGPPLDTIALAQAQARHARLDSPRMRPRCHNAHQGLYVLTGLGSRGLTSAALAGQVLAAWVTGAPFPIPSDLRDAVDVGHMTD
ncbi:MAG: FAD-dependent 5-carboxymethylaminomethyl-2-thiouridine(34) oxidoreductase MnmC [Leptothrix ochracea]|uniref:FAD-dependent 5-carboxymethylaminomethyl-2-thiouridine(34) oxidoreductase MnmC n=1 Tax=Leptothrix ochracea TaxID=735331 RepID=UPI0034E1C228